MVRFAIACAALITATTACGMNGGYPQPPVSPCIAGAGVCAPTESRQLHRSVKKDIARKGIAQSSVPALALSLSNWVIMVS